MASKGTSKGAAGKGKRKRASARVLSPLELEVEALVDAMKAVPAESGATLSEQELSAARNVTKVSTEANVYVVKRTWR